jgi:hypothetical protein
MDAKKSVDVEGNHEERTDEETECRGDRGGVAAREASAVEDEDDEAVSACDPDDAIFAD